jgi:hypothetical protein
LAQLISFAQRSGDPAFLKQSLAALSKVRMGNTVGYASLVSTLSATNNLDEMFFVYARMKEERVPLNNYSASALINTSLRHNKLERYTHARRHHHALWLSHHWWCRLTHWAALQGVRGAARHEAQQPPDRQWTRQQLRHLLFREAGRRSAALCVGRPGRQE